jgi:hypothetical protein
MSVNLRYMGFDQKQSVRTYRFEGISSGEPTLYFIVTADLSLFLARHVGIQEGPTLCAHKLASNLLNASPGRHELTDEDLLAHMNARAMAEAAHKARSRRT